MEVWKRCPHCAEKVEARLRTCPFCELPFADPPPSSRSGIPRWVLVIVPCVLIGLVLAAIVVPTYLNSGGARYERNSSCSLKTIATAQADFRSNDRDNNGVRDFWTGDIAGLYCIDNSSQGVGTPTPIKLIEVSIALADIAPTPGLTIGKVNNYGTHVTEYGTQSAKAGYWYSTLVEDPEATARGERGIYAQNTGGALEPKHNERRFGAAAMPEVYGSSGKLVFMINEGNTLYKRDFGGDVLKTDVMPPTLTGLFDRNWPRDATLGAHWTKSD